MSHDSQRIAVVTGASRGLGRAAARALALEGWRVICAARSQKALEALDDEVRALGAAPLVLVPLDLKDLDGIDRLAASVFERYQRLDALASCAAVLGALTPVSHASPRVMDETFAVNVHAAQRLIRAFHPLLRASESGRAVFVTCEAAHAHRAYWAPYGASKAALEQIALVYSAECAITPIGVNLYDPGPLRTGLRAKAFPGEDPETQTAPEAAAVSLVALLRADCTLRGARVRYGDEAP